VIATPSTDVADEPQPVMESVPTTVVPALDVARKPKKEVEVLTTGDRTRTKRAQQKVTSRRRLRSLLSMKRNAATLLLSLNPSQNPSQSRKITPCRTKSIWHPKQIPTTPPLLQLRNVNSPMSSQA